MPLLRLSEERFDPDFAFSHRLCVRLSRVVATHPLQVRLVKAAADSPSPQRGRAAFPERTSLAVGRRCLVDPPMRHITLREEAQHLLARAVVDVGGRIIAEVLLGEDARVLASFRKRDVRTNALVLDRDNVLGGAVLAIAGYLPGMKLPTKLRPPE